MTYPGQQQGGGGWLNNALGFLGQGAMGTNPVAMGAMGVGQLLTGLLGAFASGNKQKKAKKAFESQQKQYQQQAARLFPELSRESFQYRNPELTNAAQAALAYRMGNMFGNWGMPPDMRQNAGSLNDFFAAMMPRQA